MFAVPYLVKIPAFRYALPDGLTAASELVVAHGAGIVAVRSDHFFIVR
jgi:hypothetical protein